MLKLLLFIKSKILKLRQQKQKETNLRQLINDVDERLSKITSFLQEAALINIGKDMPINVLSVSSTKTLKLLSDTATKLLSVSKFIIDHKVQANIQKRCNQIKDNENENFTNKDLFSFECENSSDHTFEKGYALCLIRTLRE